MEEQSQPPSGVAASSSLSKTPSFMQRVEPGDAPQPAPPALARWASQTTAAVFCGMLYGGYGGLVDARRAPDAAEEAIFANHRHRAAAYFARGSILQGARVGVFVAVLSGVAAAVGSVRAAKDEDEVRDGWTMSGAAAATCGVFGGVIGGWRSAVGAAAFGGIVGGLAGWGEVMLERAVLGEYGLKSIALEGKRAKVEERRLEVEAARVAAEELVRSLEREQRERRHGELREGRANVER
jgi:hypothetical protein